MKNYYLAAYYAETREIRHYRVDKIRDLQLLPDQTNRAIPPSGNWTSPGTPTPISGMFNGKKTPVEIRVTNEKAGIFIDRFGKDIMLIPRGPMR